MRILTDRDVRYQAYRIGHKIPDRTQDLGFTVPTVNKTSKLNRIIVT